MASRRELQKRQRALEQELASYLDPRGGAPPKEEAVAQLNLPEPVGLQKDWVESEASRKVLRVGRRGGKTRFALITSLVGHGPEDEQGKRPFPGVLDGGDVVWIAQDYPNLTTIIWREEFLPRFRGIKWAQLNAADHYVSIPGLGSLYLRSAEAIDSVRGIGKNLRGVIIDEAAHLDLERALQDVVLPALLDNQGWLILMSTTNAAWDGNVGRVLPSYFNRICEEIRAGKRTKNWEAFYGTAFDNPVIDDAGVNELVAEYAPGSAAMEQEVYAKLLVGGVGLALDMLDEKKHIVPRFKPPSHWRQFGAFDWGYNHWWVFGWFTMDEDGVVTLVDTIWGRRDLPEQIAKKIGKIVPVDKLSPIVAGHDVFVEKGRAIGFTGPTIAQIMTSHGVTLSPGDIRRVLGLDNLRRYLAHDEHPPRFVMMETDGNRRVFQQLASMQIDPRNLEDALKVDATESGEGGDDGYDMVRYGLMRFRLYSQPPPPERVTTSPEHFDPEMDPHYDQYGRARVVTGRGCGGRNRVALLTRGRKRW